MNLSSNWLTDYDFCVLSLSYLVADLDFSGPTYQIKIKSKDEANVEANAQEFWCFLQLDNQRNLKDAFCGCVSCDSGCQHLAMAYFTIFQENNIPLHEIFEKSFWNQIFHSIAKLNNFQQHPSIFSNSYIFTNDLMEFSLTNLNDSQLSILTSLDSKEAETPENSIKFCACSEQCLADWHNGITDESLAYTLSRWQDLAKMFFLRELPSPNLSEFTVSESASNNIEIHATQDPLKIHWCFKDISACEPLLNFIPLMNSSLIVKEISPEIIAASFNTKDQILSLINHPSPLYNQHPPLNNHSKWSYLSGKGFYKIPPEHEHIAKEELLETLKKYQRNIEPFIPICTASISYTAVFDTQGNWHFSPYLFTPNDLENNNTIIAPGIAFIKERGFIFTQSLFPQDTAFTVMQEKVAAFIEKHSDALNTIPGFRVFEEADAIQNLDFFLSENHTLYFQERTLSHNPQLFLHFGHWVYQPNKGFFKNYVRPEHFFKETEIPSTKISSFIDTHIDILKQFPHFFINQPILKEVYLHIKPQRDQALLITPHFSLTSEFESSAILFFGKYIYLNNQGFAPIPAGMNLPERYRTPYRIEADKVKPFLISEIQHLKPFIKDHPIELRVPSSIWFEIKRLTRNNSGSLIAIIDLCSELGRVPFKSLIQSLHQKTFSVFSPAGYLNSHNDFFHFLSLLSLHPDLHSENTVALSVIEYLKLDAIAPIKPAFEVGDSLSEELLVQLKEFCVPRPPASFDKNHPLRPYQNNGLLWLWFLYHNNLSGLLCDEMGLGKTHQAIALIGTVSTTVTKDILFLVIAPTGVLGHWEDRLTTYLPHLDRYLFHKDKKLESLPKKGIILTSYGTFRRHAAIFKPSEFEVVVFDEIQMAKNADSKLHKQLKNITAKMRLGLTGTPIENNLHELKALFDIILPGYMPPSSLYKQLFVHPIEKKHNSESMAQLNKFIAPFILRRTKKDVLPDLPAKTEMKMFCELSPEQNELYFNLLRKEQNLVEHLQNLDKKVEYIHIFTVINHLKQICNHPAVYKKTPDNYKNHASGKWELFTTILEEALANNSKVVIFSQYLLMLNIIKNYLHEKNIEFAHIRGSTVDRSQQIKAFQERPSCRVFVASLLAAGVGIDLTAGSTVIMYDRWWNPSKENQAIDRVHRIGQTEPVMIYKLITKNTLEEKIDKIISSKEALIRTVIPQQDQHLLRTLKREDLLEILSYKELSEDGPSSSFSPYNL
ncbi:Uncharacterized protein CLAVI_000167 [Candidatus Clavichlamydia salmonicola]|uniref:DEAD/DEAH box helicase n=1 Tax=Candidatus Clavichlamydia salmonicola TaxID=469812 RepID=UPI00189193EB|nr:DEAD/DEAH box helicase [Candidatus Clavichlamydia salmonicola]MBF5050556.1 Uncharacterized protein [Candidatus Clavichlamydia salmonicola]